VAVGALGGGEPDQLLGAGQPVVEGLGLAGPELLVLGLGDQQGSGDAGDLAAEPVLQDLLVEVEARVATDAVGLAAEAQGRPDRLGEALGPAHLPVEGVPLGRVLDLGAHEAGQPLGPGGGHVDHPGVGHGGHEAVLDGQRPRHPEAAPG